MSEQNARDTQFQGFARSLFDELYDQFNALRYLEYDMAGLGRDKEVEQARQNIHETIARRAYDLAVHVLNSQHEIRVSASTAEERLYCSIPDMTELPKEQEG